MNMPGTVAAQGAVPMIRTAIISADGRYRYSLGRQWGTRDPCILWVMLNPSTADANKDDPTIKRCIGFSQRWGFDRMLVGNLFAYRATNPHVMLRLPYREAEGPDNRACLHSMALEARMILVAWGNMGAGGIDATSWGKDLYALAVTQSGAPVHPLARGRNRVPDSAIPTLWRRI